MTPLVTEPPAPVSRTGDWKTYVRVVGPVAVTALWAGLLSYSIDRSQASSVLSAVLGIMLLVAVFVRQMAEVMALRAQLMILADKVRLGNDQLAAVAEIIGLINRGPHFGGVLGLVLEKVVNCLRADCGSVWLPAPGGDQTLRHVEGRGWPDSEAMDEVLEQASRALDASDSPLATFRLRVPGGPESVEAHALACAMSDGKQSLGCLLVARTARPFAAHEQGIVAAVAVNLAAGIRSIRALGEARRMADLDPVTSVYNHRSGYQRLQTALRSGESQKIPVAVLMMDVDNFKLFNDTYGHPAGDDVLKRVAEVLSKSCRDGDTVARYGGDEFIMVLPGAALPQAMRCAERIRTALAREQFRCEASDSLPIGFSYGIAVYPDDAVDARELVTIADRHLYDSKAQGGNQITARGQRVRPDQLYDQLGFEIFWPMVVAVDNKDGYTRRHSEEVTAYSIEIAERMKLEPKMLDVIRVCAMVHDVGKIAVPDEILRKPGKLTDEEFEVMKQHPELGAMLVGVAAGAFPEMDQVILGVRHHHERYDGKGYPAGLAGADIPEIGRILAVADTFSAMTTNRPYRKGYTEPEALAEIAAGLGTQFDPEIGGLFVTLRSEALRQRNDPLTAPAPKKSRKSPTSRSRTKQPAAG